MALEKSKSANEILNVTVFWPHDNDGGQPLTGVDLNFDDDALQPNDGTGIDTRKHIFHYSMAGYN